MLRCVKTPLKIHSVHKHEDMLNIHQHILLGLEIHNELCNKCKGMHCTIVENMMEHNTGWAKKVSLIIFVITLSTASQFS